MAAHGTRAPSRAGPASRAYAAPPPPAPPRPVRPAPRSAGSAAPAAPCAPPSRRFKGSACEESLGVPIAGQFTVRPGTRWFSREIEASEGAQVTGWVLDLDSMFPALWHDLHPSPLFSVPGGAYFLRNELGGWQDQVKGSDLAFSPEPT